LTSEKPTGGIDVVVVVVVVAPVVDVVLTARGGAVVVFVSDDEQAAARTKAMRRGIRRTIGAERSGGWLLHGPLWVKRDFVP
jgi:hypothetical protein